MKTNPLVKSIRKKAYYLIMCITIISGLISCSTEEITEDNVVGIYTNLTDNSNTEITIQQASDHFTFKCIFDDNREGSIKSYIWTGTFNNIPSDVVMNGNEEIGTVKFSSGSVEFKAYTQREGTYKGYRDDLADLGYSRSNANDSVIVAKDSIMSETLE
ncbi:MAG: hypothetical protein H9777_12445 [Candidatus Phocaeicola faecigallinarum]|uniref:Uncharacterized protein n=1 Tax=Candidatus Phocaeicola faecigallinarum TaxID=2838732 RepID=A0A948TDB7_9BACT|nr:hypothetical protein [Candidatus Phocaeicola faecigallinarum]